MANTLPDSSTWVTALADAYQLLVASLEHDDVDLESRIKVLESAASPRNPLEDALSKYIAYEVVIRCATIRNDADSIRSVLATLAEVQKGSSHGHVAVSLCALVGRSLNGLPIAAVANAVKAYIDTNYHRRVTIAALAVRHGVAAGRLNRTFLRLFDSDIREYLMRVRVSAGMQLIEGGLKVEAAAWQVGYSSKKNFYIAVRRVTGLTPLRVARAHNGCTR